MGSDDCVWFWQAGTWKCAQPILSGPCASEPECRTLVGMRTSIERMGFVCRFGSISIGPPSTPPKEVSTC